MGLLDRLQFSGSIINFMQGGGTSDALRKAAGDNASLTTLAYLIAAPVGQSREGKLTRLQELMRLGQPDAADGWARALQYRAKRDTEFLSKPFSRADKTTATAPNG
jgi:hypothetical protein